LELPGGLSVRDLRLCSEEKMAATWDVG